MEKKIKKKKNIASKKLWEKKPCSKIYINAEISADFVLASSLLFIILIKVFKRIREKIVNPIIPYSIKVKT